MSLAQKLSTVKWESYLAELDATPMADWLAQNRLRMHHTIRTAKDWPRKPDRDHRVPAARRYSGWLFPVLQATESLLWGRWYWHMLAWAFMRLPDEPLPQIDFCDSPDAGTRKMIERCLDTIANEGYGSWQGWSSYEYFDYFLDWLLFAFGHLPEEPKEPSKGAYDRLYQVFCLEAMVAYPYDYLGDLMAENRHGRSQGFYPTPLCLVKMMSAMTFGEDPKPLAERTTCDPCVGTGRMLLAASNHCVRLYGIDINNTCVKATLVNGFLYAPWLVRPFSWLERDRKSATTDQPSASPEEPPAPSVKWVKTRRGNLQGTFALT